MRRFVTFHSWGYRAAEILQGRRISRKYRELRRFYALPPGERRRANRRALYDLLSYAGRHIPYYRDLFVEYKFKAEWALDDASALEGLPFLTRDIVAEQGDRLCAPDLVSLFSRPAPGFIDEPFLSVQYDRAGLDWASAAHLLSMDWAGKKLGDREVYFVSRPAAENWRPALANALKRFILRRALFFVDGLGEADLSAMLSFLRRFRPRLAAGQPAVFQALARHIQTLGPRRPPAPLFDIFENIGGNLEASQRELIERVMGCRVSRRYGRAEFGVVAHEMTGDKTNGLRLMERHVWAEQAPLGDGLSELALTGLNNRGQPLIRYRSGDLGEVESDGVGVFIRRLETVSHEIVDYGLRKLPSSLVQDLLKGLGGVNGFSLNLADDGQLKEIAVVMPPGSRRQECRHLLRERIGPDLTVVFAEPGESRPPIWRNHFSYVVQDRKPAVSVFSSDKVEDGGVAAVAHSLAINGANNFLWELFRLFKGARRFKVLAFSEGPMRRAFEELGLPVEVVSPDAPHDFKDYGLILGNTLMTARVLGQALDQGRPVAVVAHENWNPLRLRQHIDAFDFRRFVSEREARRVLGEAGRIIFPAAFQAELYRPLIAESDRIRFIYNPLNFHGLEEYKARVSKQAARRELGLGDDQPVFLQLGTVTPRKNQRATLRAFNLFRLRNPRSPARLILLGARRSRRGESVYLDSLLKEIETLKLGNSVSVLEVRPDPQIYLRAADVMLHPSLNEVLPYALMEAGIFGIPVVASGLDGIPELIEDGVSGCLIDPHNLPQIVSSLERLAGDAGLGARLGARLGETVKIRHAPERIRPFWEEILFGREEGDRLAV